MPTPDRNATPAPAILAARRALALTPPALPCQPLAFPIEEVPVLQAVRRLALPLILASGAAVAQPAPQPPATPPSTAPAQPPAAAEALPAPPPPVPDRGDFKVVYEKVKSPDNRELQEIFRGTQLLEETARALNEKLALPADVTVSPRECGAADATWEADKRRISICYELVGDFAALFLRAMKQPDASQVGNSVAAASLFVVFHEAGHALIHLYQLPVAGREEEAADQIATLILLGSGKEGGTTAVDSTSTLLTQEKSAGVRAQLAKLPFWSGHGFDEARLTDILCWVYGRDPQAFQELAGDGTLPAARAGGCAAEYEKVAKAWSEPLAPYLKGWTLLPPPPPPPATTEPPSPPPPSSPPPPRP
jgi:Putative metallopeptidase